MAVKEEEEEEEQAARGGGNGSERRRGGSRPKLQNLPMATASTTGIVETRHAYLSELANHGGQQEEVYNITMLVHTKEEAHRRRIEFIYLTNPGSVTHCSWGGTRRGHGGGALLAARG